jgi:HK97 family phage major capsid protein
MTPTLSEQIISRERAYANGLETIERLVAAGQRGPAVEAALDDAAAARQDIDLLRHAESLAAQRALPISVARSTPPYIGAPASSMPRARPASGDAAAGTSLAQVAIAHAIAKRDNRPLDDTVQALFPEARGPLAIARSLVGAADTTTAGWAAELVRTETRGMLQTDLAPISVAAALAVRGVSVDFDGAASAVIPAITLRGTAAAGAWVAEGGTIPVVKGTVAASRLNRYKLAGIIPLTKELERASDPAAVEVMRTLLVQSTANLLDTNLLDALPAVDGVRPAGLLFGVTPTAGAVGGGPGAVLKDLQTLVGGIVAVGLGSKVVLIVNPAQYLALGLMTDALGNFIWESELAKGRLRVADIVFSPAVPAGTVVAVDAAVFGSAFDGIELDLNDSATLQMANADAVAPTQAGTAAFGGALGTAGQVVRDGGIPVSGGSGASVAGAVAVSLWQTWSLALRLVVPASWAVLHAGAVTAVNAVSW